MEAKTWQASVMTNDQLYNAARWAGYRTDKYPLDIPKMRAAVEEQAEIAFKAGQEAERKRIAELIRKIEQLRPIIWCPADEYNLRYDTNTGSYNPLLYSPKWQSLKAEYLEETK